MQEIFYILPFVNKKSKKIYEFHWIVSRPFKEARGASIVERIGRRLSDVIGNHYDGIVLLTQKDKENIENDWKNVEVIPNACTFTCETRSELLNNSAIAVGNLFHVKGFSRLIDVWNIVYQRYPEWSLSIYGDGYFIDILLKIMSCTIMGYLRTIGIGNINGLSLTEVIKLEGKVKNIRDAYMQSSFSLISSYEESFSLTLLEAQACGLPVIAFDCPYGPSELITQGVDGFLIPDGDIQAFADKVCELIENKELRNEMGHNAFRHSKLFSEEEVMSRWVKLLD